MDTWQIINKNLPHKNEKKRYEAPQKKELSIKQREHLESYNIYKNNPKKNK